MAGPCPSFLVGSPAVVGAPEPTIRPGLWPVSLGSLPSHPVLQEVAVEALLQATGLPADLVHHALTPLTHGHGVLVGSCTLGGECVAGAPRGVQG